MEQNRLSHSARTIILLAILAVLAACEKPLLDDVAPTAVGGSPTEANVILRFTQFPHDRRPRLGCREWLHVLRKNIILRTLRTKRTVPLISPKSPKSP